MRQVCALSFVLLSAAGAQAQSELLAERHRMLPGDSDHTWALAVGDVDADGDPDVVFANFEQQNRLAVNDGSGRFVDSPGALPAIEDSTLAVLLADLDADGDLDAFFGNSAESQNNGQNRIALNDGAGVFTDATALLPIGQDFTYAAAAGDVNADGAIDLLVGNSDFAGERNQLLLGDGGAFLDVTSKSLPTAFDRTWAVELGDPDGDGDLDAYVGNRAYGWPSLDSHDALLLNDGDGNFLDASDQLPGDELETVGVSFGDLDNDGDQDLVLGVGEFQPLNQPDQNVVYANDGLANFSPVAVPAFTIDTSGTVALGDLDGDQNLDLLAAGNGTYSPRVFLGDGALGFVEAPTTVLIPGADVPDVVLVDVDGDGDLDGLGAHRNDQNLLLLGDGQGSLFDVSPIPASVHPGPSWTGFEHTRSLAFGDLDGDGDQDFLAGTTSSQGRINHYVGNGLGDFEPAPTPYPNTIGYAFDIALGDVDGDQDLDAFSAHQFVGSWSNVLRFNDGTGVFEHQFGALPPSSGVSWSTLFVDVDADGDLDIVVGNDGDELLHLNDGAGLFTDASGDLPPGPELTTDLAAADFDADGAVDLYLANSGLPNQLWKNDGSGVFHDVTALHLPLDLDRSNSVAVGDVNGDGFVDVLIGNAAGPGQSQASFTGDPNRVYLNDGAGIFAAAVGALPADTDTTVAVALLDADGDADLDLVTGNYYQRNRLFTNDGGVFSESTGAPAVAQLTQAIAVVDLDGDGDEDAVFGNLSPTNRFLFNNTRQLQWRAVPRVGESLDLDMVAAPNTPWVLISALGTTSIELPGFGTLKIDPFLFIAVHVGTTDADGRATYGLPIPDDPVLVGLPVHWQAFLGAPLALSNLETATLTAL